MAGDWLRGHRSAIAQIRSSKHFRIGVEDLAVHARPGNADPIIVARDRSEIATKHQQKLALKTLKQVFVLLYYLSMIAQLVVMISLKYRFSFQHYYTVFI